MSLEIVYREATDQELNVLAHTLDTGVGDIENGLPSLMMAHCPSGTHIVNEGEAGTEVFVILRGRVSVVRKLFLGFTRRLARLGQGDVFGEISFLRPATRNASVIADIDSQIFRVASGELFELMNRQPPVKLRLEELAKQRLYGLH